MNQEELWEWIADREGEYSDARAMALAERLYREGHSRRALSRAMVGLSCRLIADCKSMDDAVRELAQERDRVDASSKELRRLLEESRKEGEIGNKVMRGVKDGKR